MKVRASTTNVSSKSILLSIIKIEVESKDGSLAETTYTREDEGFFTTPASEPNSRSNWEDQIGPFDHPVGEGATAVAKVAFVQFVDGSTWGDRKVGIPFLRNREVEWNRLRFLADTLRSAGEADFVHELMKPCQLPDICHLQSLYSADRGANAARAELGRMLEAGLAHREALVVPDEGKEPTSDSQAAGAGKPTPSLDPSMFVIRLRDDKTDLGPHGLTTEDCGLLLPDARFHLERKRQQLPAETSTVTIFEFKLTESQLMDLQGILNSASTVNLARFVPPELPLSVARFQFFMVDIARPPDVQSVGYFAWEGDVPDSTSPASAPADRKQAWRESQRTLQPLVEWFHGLQALDVYSTGTASALCWRGF